MARAALALAAALALVLAASALGGGLSQGKDAKPAPQWKVFSLGSSANNFTSKPGQAFVDGVGFAFGTTPNTALFLTSHRGSGLLGDLTGKTLTATFTITGTATAFTYNQSDQTHCGLGAPASVSLYFEGNTKGPSTNSQQWWSNQSYTLERLVGVTLTLTVPLDAASWSGKGVLASEVPADFAAAVAAVGAVGVSFNGGGCFANGVAPTDGTASFVLKSYSAS